ncbi:hypothetical protein CHARACLAT_032623 [Characodon lateralis]|uniref:Uncharacterized protein n=1 Tax=Characodon lateralis TaxID=208331 RepID=A0ABU7EPC1_9TELE|nr:hypothetical protein [Characodon lateralis]
MSVILGARGILTALGQYSAVTASQRVSLPRLKKDELSHLQAVVIYSFKQQCHNQQRFRDRETSQSPAVNPAIQLTGRRENTNQASSPQDERTPEREEQMGKDGTVWTVVGGRRRARMC